MPDVVSELIIVTKDAANEKRAEPIYGGYANASGLISLLGHEVAFRINLKQRTVQQSRPLNPGARQRYDGVQAGEEFIFAGKTFRRLPNSEIVELCASGSFRESARQF